MHTTDTYLAVFRSLHRRDHAGCGASRNESDGESWPFDMGDDPSFFGARTVGASLTWGVCRQQARNRIRLGDIVVFFSVRGDPEDKAPFEYRLCAVATVGQKASQADIWTRPELEPYRRYSNLLIRPVQRGQWEHYEPMRGVNHRDWLWRIADHGGLRKRDFRQLQAGNLLTPESTIRGRPVSIAENYVIFSARPDETHIIVRPPLVAVCNNNGQPEEWLRSRISRAIRAHTLGVASEYGSHRDSLRSVNKQHSHPLVRWRMPSDKAARWRAELFALVSRFL